MTLHASGFSSVGHLLSKPQSSHLQALRHFCTVLFCNVDDSEIEKSCGFQRFDQFFKHVEPGVDTFAKFVRGVLLKRRPDHGHHLQIQVERLVWDLVKYDFDCYKGLDRSSEQFKLFCLFNRFCFTHSNPMVLSEKVACFLCQELDISFIPKSTQIDVHTFFRHVETQRRHLDERRLKRIYDEYVRDIIKEGRCRYKRLDSKAILGGYEKAKRTISITSRGLIIYGESENLDEPHKVEPTGKRLHEISLLDIEPKVIKSLFGKHKMYLQLISRSKASNPVLELVFDQVRDHFDLFSWSQAIQESAYQMHTNTSQLYKALVRLGLSEDVVPRSTPPGEGNTSAPSSPVRSNNNKDEVGLLERKRSNFLKMRLTNSTSSLLSYRSVGSVKGIRKEDIGDKIIEKLLKREGENGRTC